MLVIDCADCGAKCAPRKADKGRCLGCLRKHKVRNVLARMDYDGKVTAILDDLEGDTSTTAAEVAAKFGVRPTRVSKIWRRRHALRGFLAERASWGKA